MKRLKPRLKVVWVNYRRSSFHFSLVPLIVWKPGPFFSKICYHFMSPVFLDRDSLLTWERRRWGKLQQAPLPRNRWHPVNICNHRYHFPCIIILHTFQPNIAFTLTGGLTQSDCTKCTDAVLSLLLHMQRLMYSKIRPFFYGTFVYCDPCQLHSSISKWIVSLICKQRHQILVLEQILVEVWTLWTSLRSAVSHCRFVICKGVCGVFTLYCCFLRFLKT